MPWEQYQVWTESQDGYQELVDTTKSLKEARAIAQGSFGDDIVIVQIYLEADDGDPALVEELTK